MLEKLKEEDRAEGNAREGIESFECIDEVIGGGCVIAEEVVDERPGRGRAGEPGVDGLAFEKKDRLLD